MLKPAKSSHQAIRSGAVKLVDHIIDLGQAILV
jgi:hypothetical protein